MVEVSDSSLGYDLGRKAGLYTGFGIAELWMIDAARLTTRIHLRPGPYGHHDVAHLLPEQRLASQAAGALAVTLKDLDPW